MRTHRRRVWLAKISRIDRHPEQLSLIHQEFEPDLLDVLEPSHRHIFYGREWRLSQPHADDRSRSLFGKLGFARGTRAEQVDYIEAEHDWVTVDTPAKAGNYSHFVVDLDTQIVAFEERGVDLSKTSFVNALGLFLADGGYEVNLLSDAADFDVWLRDMDRVTRFYVTLKAPNPRWSRRARETRRLAEEIAAERLSIEATSDSHLNVRDTLLQGAADTAAMGNGEFRATGVKDGGRRYFDSRKRFVSGDIEVPDQASSGAILAEIRELLHTLQAALPGGHSDESEHTGDGAGEQA